MRYRRFGQTDLEVSEYGFGAWGIGGDSYGPVERADALAALAVAEELGCNLVDTAAVYGESEAIIGEFLKGRRDRWVVATKYSFQKDGLEKTLEQQLRRLGTDYIDFYQLHSAPDASDEIYRQLERLQASGKLRYIGVSLYSANNIRQVLADDRLDGFQVAFSLVDVQPYRQCREAIAAAGKGVLIRSSLKSGLLTGKYAPGVRFDPERDHRARDMTAEEIDRTLNWLESFRFLEQTEGSLLHAAARYPLAFATTSSVLLGARNAEQARVNFGEIADRPLSRESLERIERVQRELGIGRVNPLRSLFSRLLHAIRG
jgi:aryl-alcohol dehydrogenase-like predicted oxidoreductase